LPFAYLTTDDVIGVRTDFIDRDRMLLVPGSGYNGDSTWNVPRSWASCVVLRSLFGRDLKLDHSLIEWARREKKRIDRGMLLRNALDLPPDSPGGALIDAVEKQSDLKLRSFQRADVGYLITMGSALLAAPMGAGKTAVTIRTLQVLRELGQNPFPVIVIAPNSVKASVWPKELRAWAPELDFTVVDGSAAARRKQIIGPADVIVINWEAVALHSRVAGYGDIRLTDKDRVFKELNVIEPRAVIMDEAHRLRDASTKQSRAVKFLAHQARYRYALTGTPVNNHAGDLWGILHVIAPDWHPGRTKYMDRYVLSGYSLYGGLVIMGLNPEAEEEFRAVTLPLYRRIPKEIILPQLPPKLPVQVRHTPMTPKQTQLYRQMEKDMLTQIDDLLVAQSPMIQVMRLMQFAAASAQHVEMSRDDDGRAHYRVELSEPSGKIDDLLELLDELGDEPLVVAAVSSQLVMLAADRLKRAGITCEVIAGGMRADERAAAVDRFQSGAARVILLVLATGAEGITLTRARVLLFMQEDYRPDLNQQAEDRIHRIGSEIHSSIQIIKQITPGTVEERKPQILAEKHGMIEEVLRDRAALIRLLGGEK
jgi:SNF2 family DNA or RNA helicase